MSIQKVWTVLRYNASGAGPGLSWFTDRSKADDYARGLASRNAGQRFVIVEVVGTVQAPVPDLMIQEV